MAARRLIAVLVVLLVVSSLAAALAPEARRATDPATDSSSTSTTTTTEPETDAPPPPDEVEVSESDSRLLKRTISASPAPVGDGKDEPAEPELIEVRPGDQLELLVSSDRTVDVVIPAFGLYETAVELSPARFDLLLREPGRFAVRTAGGTDLATIVVSDEAAGDGDGQSGKTGDQPNGPEQPAPDPEPKPEPENPETQAA